MIGNNNKTLRMLLKNCENDKEECEQDIESSFEENSLANNLDIPSDQPLGIFASQLMEAKNKNIFQESDGYIFIGNYNQNGKKHGQGADYWPGGILSYEGDHVDGERSGYGLFFWRNGLIMYEGEISQGMFNGYGIKYNDLGYITNIGVWENNKFMSAEDIKIRRDSGVAYIIKEDQEIIARWPVCTSQQLISIPLIEKCQTEEFIIEDKAKIELMEMNHDNNNNKQPLDSETNEYQ